MLQFVECKQTRSGREKICVSNHTQEQKLSDSIYNLQKLPIRGNKTLIFLNPLKYYQTLQTQNSSTRRIKIIINNIQTNQIKEKITNIKEYRKKQIQEISNLCKKFENIELPKYEPMDDILNLRGKSE